MAIDFESDEQELAHAVDVLFREARRRRRRRRLMVLTAVVALGAAGIIGLQVSQSGGSGVGRLPWQGATSPPSSLSAASTGTANTTAHATLQSVAYPTPSDPPMPPTFPSPTAALGVTDTLVVSSANGQGSPVGTVTFYVCGPTAITQTDFRWSNVDTTCAPPTATSTSGATAVGSPVALTSEATSTPSSAAATSIQFTPAASGVYCLSAVYEPEKGGSYTATSVNADGASVRTQCFEATQRWATDPITVVLPPTTVPRTTLGPDIPVATLLAALGPPEGGTVTVHLVSEATYLAAVASAGITGRSFPIGTPTWTPVVPQDPIYVVVVQPSTARTTPDVWTLDPVTDWPLTQHENPPAALLTAIAAIPTYAPAGTAP